MKLALFVGIILILVAPAALAETQLIDFEIEDQFKVEHDRESLLGTPFCLVGSDRDGKVYNRLWGPAIDDSLMARGIDGEIHHLGLADLRGVPFFLKGFVRGKFPKEDVSPILMDWKGRFPQAFDFMPGECNILVFDERGELLLRHHGKEPDPQGLEKVLSALEEALAD
jgi:hypothetical protein